MARGVRRLALLSDGEELALKASGGMLRGLAVISPFCVLARPRKAAFNIKKMRSDSPSDMVCTVVRIGRRRVFSVPADGLDGVGFYARLKEIAGRGAIRLVILDGAERLSPWCDRFDPFSAGLVRFIEALGKDNPHLALLALTDRFEAVVRRDIRARLGLTDEVNGPDRHPEIGTAAFQVIRSYGQSQKATTCNRVLRKDIPAALGEPVASGRVYAPGPGGAGTGLDIRLIGSDLGGTMAGRNARALSAPSYQPLYCHPHHRPAHALEAPFPEKQAVRFHDLMIVSDAEKETAWGRFVLDITLDGGLDRWRRLVLSGGDRHCIHLTDLPSDLCEADMASRGVAVPRCSAEACVFGKKALCDYGRRHFMIQRFGPHPVAETLEALRMLDRLLMQVGSGDDPVRIAGGEDAGTAALALSRLAAIGVLANFRVLENGDFEAGGLRPSIQATEMTVAAETWRKGLGLPEERRPNDSPARKTAWIRKKYRPRIEASLKAAIARGRVCRHLKHDRLFEAAADALISVLDPFGRAVEEMAYRSLWNLKEFLRAGGCRKAALIRHYRPVEMGWRCGRCDDCDPNLALDAESVPTPLTSDGERLAVADALEQWLAGGDAGFELERGEVAREAFPDDPIYLYQRSATVLEGDPNNLRALYLARECAPENAVNMTNRALLRSACDRLPFPTVRRLYEGAAESARRLLIDILDDEFGPTHCTEGEQLLYREARALSISSGRVDRLRARCAVEALKDIDFTAWKARLHNCLEDFQLEEF